MRRQTVFNARPRKNGRCNIVHACKLLVRCIGQQGNHQIFKCDHADLQLHQFRIGKRRRALPEVFWLARAGADQVPTFIVPTRQRCAQEVFTLQIF